MFDKKIFWLASYPRSGNTWLRFILSSLFFDFQDFENKWNMTRIIPDIHVDEPKKILSAPSLNLDNKIKNISLCKTHNTKPTNIKSRFKLQQLKTVGFLYIYRHPLDVLLSAINFSYYKKINTFFLDGILKTPSELYEAGMIDQYLIDFMEKETEIPVWKGMAGSWLENVKSWSLLQKSYKDSIIINYESLVESPVQTLISLNTIFPSVDKKNLIRSLETAEKLTSSKKQNSFFWKKGTGNHKNFFNKDIVIAFYQKYKDVLLELGLDCEYY